MSFNNIIEDFGFTRSFDLKSGNKANKSIANVTRRKTSLFEVHLEANKTLANTDAFNDIESMLYVNLVLGL